MEISHERMSVRTIAGLCALSMLALAGITLLRAAPVHAITSGFGSVKVTEVVQGGGTATPSDFEVSIKKSGGANTGTLSGSGEVITFSSLTPGMYTLSESGGPSGYSTSWSGDCNAQGMIMVIVNVASVCTITHTFGAVGSIQVHEIVSGGTASPSDFTVHIKKSGAPDTGTPSGSGNLITFDQLTPGFYTVIESGGPSGYTVSWSGSCDSQGNVLVVANTTASCTITHTLIDTGGRGGRGGDGSDRTNNRPPRPGR